MKTTRLLCIGILLMISGFAHAQVAVSVTLGTPPPWGPVGYSEVRYYYIPDVQAYYDVQTSMFIYFGGGVWVHRASLPTRYSSYDLYSGYKVVMSDYHGDTPYSNYSEYKVKYAKGYRGPAQRTIGERPARKSTGSNSNVRRSSVKKSPPAAGKTEHGNVDRAKTTKSNPGHGNGNSKNK